MRKVLFSGSAPSGTLTIGNYIGAIRHWKRLAADYDCLFCVVDLHALTVPRDPALLRRTALDFIALYAACGLDPEACTVFLQSQNPHHTELAWILNGCTAHGDLARMTQFKDKAARAKAVTAGLLNYPILMAADILLYGTSLVPVGDDQRQHLELTRTIAQRFHAAYGDTFVLPEGFIPESGARIRSLLDPSRKMDKSDPDPRGYISLLDAPEEVARKIARAKTDSAGSFSMDGTEGIANLLTIHCELCGETAERIVERYRSRGYAAFKKDLADLLNAVLAPIQERFRAVRGDETGMEAILKQGKTKAMEKSKAVMERVRRAVGLA